MGSGVRAARNLAVFVLILAICLVCPILVGAAGVDPAKARAIAQGHIDAVSTDFPSDYAGAKVADKPTICLDLEGKPSAFLFNVMKGSKARGYVTVSIESGNPVVVESSNGISPMEKARIASGASKYALHYLGGIEYYAKVSSDKNAPRFVRISDLSSVSPNMLKNIQASRKAFLEQSRSAATDDAASSRFSSSSLKVTWPNAANVAVRRGKMSIIRWAAPRSIKRVSIELLQGENVVKTIAKEFPAMARAFPWMPSADLIPGMDYRIRISAVGQTDISDVSDNTFVVAGSRVLVGANAYTWYRGSVPTAEAMVLNYLGWRGFPDLRSAVERFNWVGPDDETIACYSARELADSLADALEFPKTGGAKEDYVAGLTEEIAAVRAVIAQAGYGSWETKYCENPNADTLREVVDAGRMGKVGFYNGATTYNNHSVSLFGYSFHTNTADRNARILYVHDTWDRARHEIVYESQGGEGTYLDYHDANPPAVVVNYPNSADVKLDMGKKVLIKWGSGLSLASTKGLVKARIELLKSGAVNRVITTNTLNNGYYIWRVPTSLVAGTDYRVRVTLQAGKQTFVDESDSDFSVAQASSATDAGGYSQDISKRPTVDRSKTPLPEHEGAWITIKACDEPALAEKSAGVRASNIDTAAKSVLVKENTIAPRNTANLAMRENAAMASPDLYIANSHVGSLNPIAGKTLYIENTVKNMGSSASSLCRVSWFISVDSTMTSDDYVWASADIPGINAGGVHYITGDVVWPEQITSGVYYLAAKVDTLKEVSESREDNNWGATFKVVVGDKPELYLKSSSVSVVYPSVGYSVKLTDTIRNQGIKAAGSFWSCWYISRDSSMSTSDYEWYPRRIASLAAGASNSSSISKAWPSSMRSGTYYIAMMADDSKIVSESNESNNWGKKYQVTVGTKPDLIVSKSTLSNRTVYPGDPVDISDTIKNQGGKPAGSFYVTWYISKNATMTTSDYQWAYRQVTSLGGGGSSSSSDFAYWPKSLAPGTYYVALMVDDDANVSEMRELNNWGSKFTVTVRSGSSSQ